MLLVKVIDFRVGRRNLIEKRLLGESNTSVVAKATRAELATDDRVPDLLLLHVGADQELKAKDDIAAIFTEFSKNSWVIGYFGGVRALAARANTAPRICIFPEPIPADDFPLGLRNTVNKVIARLRETPPLAPEEFKAIVTGFDQLLEDKLESLVSVLGGLAVEENISSRLLKAGYEVFDSEGRLNEATGDANTDCAKLRQMFFDN